jgi:hypothetical protein
MMLDNKGMALLRGNTFVTIWRIGGRLSTGKKLWQNNVNMMKNMIYIWFATCSVFDTAEMKRQRFPWLEKT